MDYDALIAKVIELLQREKRVPYRALKRRFDLDDDYIEDLKVDLIEAKRLAHDENDRTRLEQDKGIRLAVRLGIHTGLVVIGAMGSEGRQEQLALREVPNIAARIQGLAEPNTVLISADTYRLIQGYFACQELGEQLLRGVDQPMAIYRVLGDSGVQSRLDVASTRGLTPLVGRESEVTLLLERWNQVKDGQGQVVLLSGEGGIGKSRLVQGLKDHLASAPHTRWECRSAPYYQNTALYPLIDVFQRALQWQHSDTPDEKLNKLTQQLRQYRVPLEESIPLFAPLLSVPLPENHYPPLNLSPQRQRQKTLETLLAIVLEQDGPPGPLCGTGAAGPGAVAPRLPPAPAVCRVDSRTDRTLAGPRALTGLLIPLVCCQQLGSLVRPIIETAACSTSSRQPYSSTFVRKPLWAGERRRCNQIGESALCILLRQLDVHTSLRTTVCYTALRYPSATLLQRK